MSDHSNKTRKGIGELLREVRRIDSTNKMWYVIGLVAATRSWKPSEDRCPILSGLEHIRVKIQETPQSIVSDDVKGDAVKMISDCISDIYNMPKERPLTKNDSDATPHYTPAPEKGYRPVGSPRSDAPYLPRIGTHG